MSETIISYSEIPVWNAETYDAPRRRLVPDFATFYGTLVDLVADVASDLGSARPQVLDLGAGTGLVSRAVRDAVPGVVLTVADGSAPMLGVARQRLGDDATYVVADFADPVPSGPFDAVVSALAIHHLDDAGKQDLFGRIRAELRPGGLFVNAEQVAGPTPWHEARYAATHEGDARALGTDDAEWEAALGRMAHDRCATVDDQVAWLTAAGFERVDVAFRRYRFAVYYGFNPTS